MNVLLVRCNERLGGGIGETNVTGVYPPLGLAYIAATLQKATYPVRILDAHALDLSWTEFSSHIETRRPDAVLFTATTLGWPNVLAAARIVKRIQPSALVCVGGPQLSVYPRESLSFDCFDIGVCGEGEHTILEILRRAGERRPIDGIDGTVVRRDGQAVVHPPNAPVKDLDLLPFPAYELLPHDRYFALNVQRPFFTMITSRGCPFTCGFCAQNYAGGSFRMRSAANVVDEMEYYVKRFGAKELVIFDETFTVDKERAVTICELIRQRGLSFRWNVRTRVDTVDRELMERLKAAGCRGLHMGVESGSQAVLDAMRKGITLEQVRQAFSTAKELGFETRGYFMLGYPGETRETMRQTVRFSRQLPLDWASFTVTVPHPGTEIHRLYRERAGSDYWRDYTLGVSSGPAPYFTTDECDARTLDRLRLAAYAGFYLRPGQLLRRFFSSFPLKTALAMPQYLLFLLRRAQIFLAGSGRKRSIS